MKNGHENIYTMSGVRDLLSRHGINLRKSLGQNFLTDPNIPEKIVRLSGIDGRCGVLEIGPGVGALTAALAGAAGHVTAVELDSRLMPVLGDTVGSLPNVAVVQGDILKIDIGSLVGGAMQGMRLHVCANLPYSITTPALTAVIETGLFDTITVMVQREVARRICSGPGTADYSAFTVYVNYHALPQMLFDVPPDCFMPRPKVHSTVISLKTRGKRLLAPEYEAVFFRFTRAAFGQRRKTLANALHSAFGGSMNKPEIAALIEKCGFDADIRGEKLSMDDFIALVTELK